MNSLTIEDLKALIERTQYNEITYYLNEYRIKQGWDKMIVMTTKEILLNLNIQRTDKIRVQTIDKSFLINGNIYLMEDVLDFRY